MGRGKSRKSVLDRLNEKTIREEDCWIWIGARTHHGYGFAWFIDRIVQVHRLSAHLYLDFDLNSKCNVNHKPECKSTSCWNPAHLYVGSQQENIRDIKRKEELNAS